MVFIRNTLFLKIKDTWTLNTSSLQLSKKFQWNLTGIKILIYHIKLVFFGPTGKKKTAQSLICWGHFLLLFSTCWPFFNATWQEARRKRPLASLCFFRLIEKQVRCLPKFLIGWDIFNFFPASAGLNLTKCDGYKYSTFSTNFAFFRVDHYQHVFSFKVGYSGARLCNFGPLGKM